MERGELWVGDFALCHHVPLVARQCWPRLWKDRRSAWQRASNKKSYNEQQYVVMSGSLAGGEPDAQIALVHLVTLTLQFLHPIIYSRESEVVLLI